MPRRHAGLQLGPAHFRTPTRVTKIALLLLATTTLAVLLSTPALADPPEPRPFLKVVLLGDSYSAGNGAGDDYYGPNGCWRSTANWAEQYLDHLRSLGYAIFFENRACSGSTTLDIYNPRVDENVVDDVLILAGNWEGNPALPDHMRAIGWCPENYPDEETLPLVIESAVFDSILGSTAVSFHCDRVLEAQMDAVGADTDLVLMTTGGNDAPTGEDAGFGKIVRKCFLAVERDVFECIDLFSKADQLITQGTLRSRITLALDKLRTERNMRPDSRVVLVSYPYLEAGTNYSLDGFDVATAIRDVGERVDDEQQAAVDAANINAGSSRNVFISGVKPAFAGPPHHEPFGDFTDMNPDRWIYEFERGLIALPGVACQDDEKGNFLENYHPNLCGHAAIADLLKPFGAFEIPPTPVGGGDIDVVFVIDTTGSMGNDIAAVKAAASQVVDQLSQDFASYRFALVTYRDHPSWTGNPTDYPSRIDLDFTDETASIVSAINAIQLGDGGDTPESVYSGLLEGIGLDWRPGVKKVVLQFGDAPPHDPEPITNYTADEVVEAALAVDPAEVYVLNVSGGQAAPQLVDIAGRTGGDVFSAPTPSEVAQALTAALQQAAAKPLAVAGGPYIATVGSSRLLDGSGSVDGDGVIVLYEWDLDGDGDFDTSSAQPTYTHTFNAALDGAIALRVTDDAGLTSVAMARAHASSDGDEVPAIGDNCPNEPNHGQDDYDGDGVGDVCDPDPGFELEVGGGQEFGTGGVVLSKPSTGYDSAWALAQDDSAIYVAGFDSASGSRDWRVEKRDKQTGELVTAFGTGGFVTSGGAGTDGTRAIAVDETSIYVVGFQTGGTGCTAGGGSGCWRIEKRNKQSGALVTAFDGDGIARSDPTNGSDTAEAIALDPAGGVIYVAGWQTGGTACSTGQGRLCWRIEKRSAATGSLVTSFDTDGVVTSNPTNSDDAAKAIALDASGLYVVGTHGGGCPTGGACLRIEKRNLGSGALITGFDGDGVVLSNPTASADATFAVAVESGELYVAGGAGWYVEKRSATTGMLVNSFGMSGTISAPPGALSTVDLHSGALYIVGRVSQSGGVSWRLEKRSMIDGGLFDGVDANHSPTFGTAGVLTESTGATYTWDIPGPGLLADDGGVFLVGQEYLSSADRDWRIEKRKITTGALMDGS